MNRFSRPHTDTNDGVLSNDVPLSPQVCADQNLQKEPPQPDHVQTGRPDAPGVSSLPALESSGGSAGLGRHDLPEPETDDAGRPHSPLEPGLLLLPPHGPALTGEAGEADGRGDGGRGRAEARHAGTQRRRTLEAQWTLGADGE